MRSLCTWRCEKLIAPLPCLSILKSPWYGKRCSLTQKHRLQYMYHQLGVTQKSSLGTGNPTLYNENELVLEYILKFENHTMDGSCKLTPASPLSWRHGTWQRWTCCLGRCPKFPGLLGWWNLSQIEAGINAYRFVVGTDLVQLNILQREFAFHELVDLESLDMDYLILSRYRSSLTWIT